MKFLQAIKLGIGFWIGVKLVEAVVTCVGIALVLFVR